MPNSNPTDKIAIMGPFGFGNLGDAAIQEAMLQNLRHHYPHAQLYGLSLNPEDTEKRHGIPSFAIGRMAHYGWLGRYIPDQLPDLLTRAAYKFRSSSNSLVRLAGRILFTVPLELIGIFRASRNIKGFKLLVVSGGGQLDDYWGGPWYHPYSLLLWAILARLRGVKLLVVSVGAGPLNSAISRLFDRWALALASYRSYRDEKSKKFVREVVKLQQDDPVYPDLAFSLALKAEFQAAHPPRPVVGIGPMTYFDPRVWPEKDEQVYQDYLTKLAEITCWLWQKGYTIMFFPGEAVHDRWAIDDLKEKLQQMGVEDGNGRMIDNPIETVDSLMSHLAMADFVIASRFHGVLLSLLSHKPTLALSYHPKIDALMADTGQSFYCLPIDKFEVTTVKERFAGLEVNCSEAKGQIVQQVQKYQASLAEQYERIFGEG